MKKHTLYTSILASVIILAGSLSFSACSDEEIIDSPSLVLTGEGIFFGTSIGNGQWTPDVIGRSAKQEKQKSLVIEGEDGFSITATVEDGIKMRNNEPKPQSRGTQVTQAANVTSFDVAAYKNVDGTYEQYFIEKVTDGVNPSEKKYWPSKGTVDFIATYPLGIFDSQFPAADDYANGFSFSYTVKDNVEEQEDIMVACPKGLNYGATGEAVPLQFQHLLAAVQFKVGKMQFIKINSLSIEGVKGGTVTMTYESNQWSYKASEESTTYNVIYTTDGVPNVDTSGLTSGQYITSNDNGLIMLVIPQTLGEDQKLILNYTELITGEEKTTEIAFSGEGLTHEWVAGKTTTYALNIDTDIATIEIPSPPDADAHYVRIDMNYDLTGLSDYTNKGITISNIVASANWLEDGSNTASSDKQSIYIKTTLTELQERGFYTDELWELRYSVNSNNEKDYTVGSANGPELVDNNILGYETLDLTSTNTGTIYLFLDENDGTTDRNGELKLTADVTQNGSTKQVILSNGRFKQLAPSWKDGIGVERLEEDEEIYPYGFSYNRVVTYTNNMLTNYQKAGPLGKLFYILAIWLFGYSIDATIPDTEGMAVGFVTVDPYTDNYVGTVKKSITLNYGALNSLKNITSENSGLKNTIALYNYTGAVDLTNLEDDIDKSLGIPEEDNWTKNESSNSSNPTDYAAFIALTRNRMREFKTVITSDNETSEVTNAILHREGEGGTDNKGDESGAVIVEWYLPSYEEALNLKETGTGSETTPISPLNGTYWSSTAGEDPIQGTNGYAYSYTYINNVYSTFESEQDRTDNLKVRAVRKK